MVLALADQLEVLSKDLIGLLTAIVLVTMGITPILGDLAENISKPFAYAAAIEESEGSVEKVNQMLNGDLKTSVAEDSIIILGHAEIGRAVLRQIADYQASIETDDNGDDIPNVVAFSKNPDLVDSVLCPSPGTIVLYGDGNNPEGWFHCVPSHLFSYVSFSYKIIRY